MVQIERRAACMLVTREMDYAVRAIRALHRNGQLPAPEIARREHIQTGVTYKMLKKLAKAGIVESRRGAEGGYLLSRPCSELTLWDLFHALGEDLLLTECLRPDFLCENNPEGCCGVHREFCRIQHRLEEELKQKTLEELIRSAGNCRAAK